MNFFATGCALTGPSYPLRPQGERPKEGLFILRPDTLFYHKLMRGVVMIENPKSVQKSPPPARFQLHILGVTDSGAIRTRRYEGSAHLYMQNLELRSDRCYEFARKDWDEPERPLARWDCDHLLFTLTQTKEGAFRFIPSDKKTEWFATGEMTPFPERASSRNFAGQPVTMLQDGTIVVWALQGSRRARKDTKLYMESLTGKIEGTLRVKELIGDILLCERESPFDIPFAKWSGMTVVARELPSTKSLWE